PAATPTPASFMQTGTQRAYVNEATLQKHAEALEQAREAQARLRAQLSELESLNERLSASETRFRRIFEANALPMWIADHETNGFIAVNEAALRFYGYSRAEFLALKTNALFANGNELGAKVARHKRKDGSEASVALSTQEIVFVERRDEIRLAAVELDPLRCAQHAGDRVRRSQGGSRLCVRLDRARIRRASASATSDSRPQDARCDRGRIVGARHGGPPPRCQPGVLSDVGL